MIDERFLRDLLDSFKNSVVFVDTGHVIRYMNRAAVAQHDEGEALIGRSVFACHNEATIKKIHEVYEALQAGETERLITDDEKHRIYMRAVRDGQGRLLGYYERYEPPVTG